MAAATIPVVYHSKDDPMEYWQESLSPLLPGIQLVAPDDAAAAAAEVMITWNPPDGMIAGLANLKGVVSLAQGVDHVLKEKVFPSHLKLARLIDPYMSEAMAEWVLFSILQHHREESVYRAAAERQEWIRLRPKMASQATVAVMGLGAIGGHVASKVRMLGFNTIGWARSKKSIPEVTAYQGEDGFNTCLAEADYVVSILPLTDATRDIYNKDSFARMKPGAVFINSGRGLQVVEDDLIAALDRDHLNAAVLDVTRVEPLPAESPLWSHPKVTIWPHVSAQTNPVSSANQVVDAINAIRQGDAPLNNVDISRGY